MRGITLITDFGVKDWFVGTMKGVIYGIYPQASIVDVTHEIGRGDIRAGAFALAAAYRYFPPQTIHVAVVDPGVGSARGALAVETKDYFFVGPDNGVLSWALAKEKIVTIRRLENRKYFLPEVSQTFQGRDVFAPVAAYLSKGMPCAKFGPAQQELVRLPWPEPTRQGGEIRGEVVYIDHFGNAITNIPNSVHAETRRRGGALLLGKKWVPMGMFYQAVGKGKAVAVPGSAGFVEIAVNGGSAARKMKLKVGARVLGVMRNP